MKRNTIATAAGAALVMVALGMAAPAETEVQKEPHYGISREVYDMQMAAALREEEEIQRHKPQREVLSLNGGTQEMLLKLTMAEAGGEDLQGKALVMNVIINRVKSLEFPNTIEEVVCQPGQFSPIWDGRYYDMVPDEECEKALYMVVHGWDQSEGATYFCTPESSSWHDEDLTRLFQHGGHVFYKE